MKFMLNATLIDSPVSCYQLQATGVCYVFLFISSVPINILLVYTIFKNKQLHNPINYIIACLTINNLIGTFIQIPILVGNLFSCKFIFTQTGCAILGFALYLNINLSTFLLMLVSVERYLMICQPIKNYRLNNKRCFIWIIIIIILSLVLSTAPFYGWSYYRFDVDFINCSVELSPKTKKTLTFWVSCLLLMYAIPLIVLSLTNFSMVRTVRASSKKFRRNAIAQQKLRKESHLVNITVILIVAFFLSYTPSVICETTKSIYPTLDPVYTTFTLFIARCSLLWPSIFYILMNKDIKKLICFFK